MNRSRKTADLASHGNIFVDIANDRVGIGTTQPTHKIDVSGNIKLHDQTGYDNHITYKSSGPAPHIHLPTGPLANLGKTPYIGFGDRGDSSGDFKIYHDHYNAHLKLNANFGGGSGGGLGGLFLSNQSTSGVIGIQGSNGSGGVNNSIHIPAGATAGVKLYQASELRFETVGYGVTVHGTTETQELNVTGITTAREGVIIPDNKALSLGNRVVGSTAGDLRIYHDGSNSYIDEIGSGNLFIRNGTDTAIFCQTDGAVKLYHDGTERLATTHNSVNITGNLNVSQSIGFQSQLQCNGDVNFNGDNYNIVFDKSDSTFEFADNAKLRIGGGNHFQIFHDGTDTRFTNNSLQNIVKITSSEEVEIYKDQVKTVGITSFINMPSPTGGQTMSHTGGRIRVRSNVTDDPVAMSLGMFAAPPSGDPNVGLCTVILQSNSAKRPELRFDNIHNGNWHESNGNTQHLRLIWTAPNESSTTPEVCELKPVVANNASGTFSSFRIRTTDNSTGLKTVATFNTFGQNFFIGNNVALQTTSNGVGVPESLHHYLDTDTRLRFPTNDKITLEAGGTTRLQTTSIGIQIDNVLLINGAAGNPGRLRLQEGGALSEIRGVRNTDNNSLLYFDTEISGTTATRLILDENGHLKPSADSTYDLGITGTRWRNVYADTLYGDGSNITSVNADTLDGVQGASFLRSDADDTTTGQLTLAGTHNEKLILSGGAVPYIRFQEMTTDKAYIQWHTDGYLQLVNQESGESLRLQSGSNGLKYGIDGTFYKVWHEANDGSGSGLDADTVDGIQGASFVRSDASDTMNGNYTVTGSGDEKFVLNGTNPYIRFQEGGTNKAYLQWNSGGYFDIANQETDERLRIQSGSNGLKYLVNGTAYKVWHELNDGSGSGLDADTVDGLSASQFIRSDTSDTITKGSTWVLNHDLADWAFRFTNGNGTNAHVYMCHGTHGMHIRNDSSGTSQYLLDVYANNGNRFRIRGGDAYTTINGSAVWHAGNDGSGSGLDADTVDGLQAGSFIRSDADDAIAYSHQIRFYSNTNLHTTSAYQASLEVYQSSAGSDAFMAFHVAGDFAAYFGLDGNINDFAVGGWSMGNNRHRIWHQGNDGSGSGLDADTLDGQQGSYYKDVPSGTVMVFHQNSAPTGWSKSTSHNNKAMRIVSGNVGSGGSNNFSTAFNSSRGTSGGSVSNHTITTAQMPSHTHTGRTRNHDVNNSGSQGYPAGDQHNAHRTTDRAHNRNMATGTHTNTGSSNSHNHGFSNPSFNLNVRYVDFIICTRS